MEILQEQKEESGNFYIEEQGNKLARLNYHIRNNDRLIIDHTEVSEQLQGKGIGQQLVDSAVDYAREHDMKVVPLCSYANKLMRRTSKYEDVL